MSRILPADVVYTNAAVSSAMKNLAEGGVLNNLSARVKLAANIIVAVPAEFYQALSAIEATLTFNSEVFKNIANIIKIAIAAAIIMPIGAVLSPTLGVKMYAGLGLMQNSGSDVPPPPPGSGPSAAEIAGSVFAAAVIGAVVLGSGAPPPPVAPPQAPPQAPVAPAPQAPTAPPQAPTAPGGPALNIVKRPKQVTIRKQPTPASTKDLFAEIKRGTGLKKVAPPVVKLHIDMPKDSSSSSKPAASEEGQRQEGESAPRQVGNGNLAAAAAAARGTLRKVAPKPEAAPAEKKDEVNPAAAAAAALKKAAPKPAAAPEENNAKENPAAAALKNLRKRD